MQLTILGNGPACPNIGGASSGYLVSAGSTHLAMDLGPGVESTVSFRQALPHLTGILLSHLHSDHWLSLVPLGYLLKVGPNPPRNDRVKVWAPPGSAGQLRELMDALALGYPFDMYDIREYNAGDKLRFPGAEVSFSPVKHYVPAFAMRVAADGGTVTYSGDSAPCAPLVELAAGTDLLLCEATHGTDLPEPGRERGHMTAAEAG